MLGEIGDIERLASRARLGVASPRDLVALGRALGRLPALGGALAGASEDLPGDRGGRGSAAARQRSRRRSPGPARRHPARRGPRGTKEGGFIRPAFGELDELCSTRLGRARSHPRASRRASASGPASARSRSATTSVFGYYIEVTRANLHLVPADYVRKQTVADGRALRHPGAQGVRGAGRSRPRSGAARSSCELFEELRAAVGAAGRPLQALAATRWPRSTRSARSPRSAHRHGYVRPDGRRLATCSSIADGRHPVVERLLPRASFVPNDVRLDREARADRW